MQKNLVIVESPAKAKTIEKFLGKDFKVMSSYGHIRDLKKKELSIDDTSLEPEYEIPDEKKKLVSELKKQAKEAEKVWLASDEDREGEAISWHLCEVLGLDEEKTNRIVFHEITGERPAGPPRARPSGWLQAVARAVAQGEAGPVGWSCAERGRQTDCRA